MKQSEIIDNLQRECDLLHETLAGVLAIAGDYGPFGGDEGVIIEAAERIVRQTKPPEICARCGYGRTRHTATQDLGHAFVEAGVRNAN